MRCRSRGMSVLVACGIYSLVARVPVIATLMVKGGGLWPAAVS